MRNIFLICLITMLAGCARNDGKKTFEFLEAEHGILENTKIELKQCIIPHAPIVPTPPVFKAGENLHQRLAEKRQYAEETKQYHDALKAYWNIVIQNTEQAARY